MKPTGALVVELPAASGETRPLPLEGPTEVRVLTERFNAMAHELASTRQEETQLLANLRHDLRTPLTSIGGFAEAIADGTASGDRAASAARTIAEEAQRHERLVGELGVVERLRQGPASLRPEALDAAALLLCESDGTAEEVEDEIARMTAVLKASGAYDFRISQNEAERLKFWSGRKAAFSAVGRISPDYYCMDGTIPRKRLGEVLHFIATLEKKYGLRCPNVFHAGDGNLHPLILFDANDPEQLHRTEAFAGEVLEKCIAVGGTVTGEHGVGIEKINQMCVQFTPNELEMFRAVKRAFDPENLLNPEKNIPTLRRCAEFGRMHVKGGQLPHPELPRF